MGFVIWPGLPSQFAVQLPVSSDVPLNSSSKARPPGGGVGGGGGETGGGSAPSGRIVTVPVAREMLAPVALVS